MPCQIRCDTGEGWWVELGYASLKLLLLCAGKTPLSDTESVGTLNWWLSVVPALFGPGILMGKSFNPENSGKSCLY